ncbi:MULTISPECIES: glypican family protein [Streptomyces]|uniref:glypican family protein n=1 Tax=Streptomyces TaxID=1883 RepID=UPI001F149860|nr:glypican family protein [Streptomyces sp. SID10115]
MGETPAGPATPVTGPTPPPDPLRAAPLPSGTDGHGDDFPGREDCEGCDGGEGHGEDAFSGTLRPTACPPDAAPAEARPPGPTPPGA